MGTDKADILYSDPPWGNGNISYWATINKRHNNENTDVLNYAEFLHQVFTIASLYVKPEGIIVIEYGRKWEAEVINAGKEHGLNHLGVVEITYKSGSKLLPHHMHFFSQHSAPPSPQHLQSLAGRTGLQVMIDAVRPWIKGSGILLDPCCGLGLSLRLAMEIGYDFRGNELNITRLNKTMALVK